MAGRVTQVPRGVAIEPGDPVARTTHVVRRTAVEPTPTAIATQVARMVLIPMAEGAVIGFTSQVSRLVVIPCDEDSVKMLTSQVSRRVAFAAPVVSGGERSFGYIIG